MKELTMNEIIEISGGCECWCRDPYSTPCYDIGRADSLQDCINACKRINKTLCYCK